MLAAQLVSIISIDSDVLDWRRRVRANGGSISIDTLWRVSRFAKNLKANSLWNKFVRINVCAGNQLAASVVPLITGGSANDSAVAMTSTDYAERTGWITDGSTKYIYTHHTIGGGAGGIAVYLRTPQTSNSTGYELMGSNTASGSFRLAANRDASGNSLAGWLGGRYGAPDSRMAAADLTGVSPGLYHTCRRTTIDLETYRNGISLDTETASVGLGSGDSQPITVMALNNSTVIQNYLLNGSAVSAYSIDSSMTAAEASAYYKCMQQFQTAMGRGV